MRRLLKVESHPLLSLASANGFLGSSWVEKKIDEFEGENWGYTPALSIYYVLWNNVWKGPVRSAGGRTEGGGVAVKWFRVPGIFGPL
jgi:hypothetical protein